VSLLACPVDFSRGASFSAPNPFAMWSADALIGRKWWDVWC
jgi:hypothetical protein